MLKHFQSSLLLLACMTILTGVIYPVAVTAVSQCVFPESSNGSLIVRDGNVIGSKWIGQSFTRPDYFWGRLSATAEQPYNASSSGGSNLGAQNPKWAETMRTAKAAHLQFSDRDIPIPVDLVTSSGSGLDPHISPAAALYQVPRIAKQRGMDETQVRDLVNKTVEDRQFGILGEPRVNVLMLNLELDRISRASMSGKESMQ